MSSTVLNEFGGENVTVMLFFLIMFAMERKGGGREGVGEGRGGMDGDNVRVRERDRGEGGKRERERERESWGGVGSQQQPLHFLTK